MLASTLTTVAVFLPVLFVQRGGGAAVRRHRPGDQRGGAARRWWSRCSSCRWPPPGCWGARSGRGPGPPPIRQPGSGRHSPPAWSASTASCSAAGCGRSRPPGRSWRPRHVATWLLLPKVEYLPEGNRNLVFGILLPPPGLQPRRTAADGRHRRGAAPALLGRRSRHARGRGPRRSDPRRHVLRGPGQERVSRAAGPRSARGRASSCRWCRRWPPACRAPSPWPSNRACSSRASARAGRSTSRSPGPDLAKLVQLGGRVMGMLAEATPGSQNLPKPSLDLSSPEVQLVPRLRAGRRHAARRPPARLHGRLPGGRRLRHRLLPRQRPDRPGHQGRRPVRAADAGSPQRCR